MSFLVLGSMCLKQQAYLPIGLFLPGHNLKEQRPWRSWFLWSINWQLTHPKGVSVRSLNLPFSCYVRLATYLLVCMGAERERGEQNRAWWTTKQFITVKTASATSNARLYNVKHMRAPYKQMMRIRKWELEVIYKRDYLRGGCPAYKLRWQAIHSREGCYYTIWRSCTFRRLYTAIGEKRETDQVAACRN